MAMRPHAPAVHWIFALASALLAAGHSHAQFPSQHLGSPLVTASADALPAQLRDSVTALAPDEQVWKAMSTTDHVRLEAVPVSPTRTVNLLLSRIDPFTPDARLVTATIDAKGQLHEQAIPRPAGQWWGGTVEGQATSKVMLSRSAAGILGFIQDEHGTTIITGDRIGGTGPLVSYVLGELPPGTIAWEPWTCQELTAPGDEELNHHGSAPLVQPCRQLRIAVETDAELYQRFAASTDPTAAASAYVGTIFAGINQIYQRDLQIKPHINFLRLWPTAADPWTMAGAGDQLNEFRTWWQTNMVAQPRDLAAMFSTRGLGGGVAWLSVACNTTWGYSVSGNLAGAFPYPLIDNDPQNWDIMVTSHEIGHNMGTTHTHNFCPEPGDSCSPSGYFGSCQTAQVCTTSGTIMSYCHLCSGGLGNVILSFHPLCINAVSTYMSNACNTVEGASGAASVDDWFEMVQGSGSILIDVLANDIDSNCEAITLESFDAVSVRGGTVTRVVGAGAGGRDLLRYTPSPEFVSTDRVTYRVREQSGGISPSATAHISVLAMRQPENPFGDTPGLTTKYYAVTGAAVLPDFAALTPYLTNISTQVNYASTNGNFATSLRADDVAAQWTGWVQISQSGTHTFSLTSDDGSRLRIGNTVVVLNDGLHGMQEVTGTIALAAGKHAITIDFFEAGGGAGCIAQLEGPGLTKAPIAAARLTRAGTVNRFDLTNDGRVNGADLGGFLAQWGASGGPADFDGNGRVEGADLGSLLSAWTG